MPANVARVTIYRLSSICDRKESFIPLMGGNNKRTVLIFKEGNSIEAVPPPLVYSKNTERRRSNKGGLFIFGNIARYSSLYHIILGKEI